MPWPAVLGSVGSIELALPLPTVAAPCPVVLLCMKGVRVDVELGVRQHVLNFCRCLWRENLGRYKRMMFMGL